MKILFCWFALLAILTAPLEAQSIIGSWYSPKAGGAKSKVVLTFLANGVYTLGEDGDSGLDPSGRDGMERGTYKWSANSGRLTNKTLIDTNGAWGLSSGEVLKVSITGNTMKLDGVGFKKVLPDSSKIVGTWYLRELGGYSLVTFLADGKYFHVQDGKDRVGGERNGMERGTYRWEPATGVLKTTVLRDTNGEWGFSHKTRRIAVVSGGRLRLDVAGEGRYLLSKVAAP